MAHDFNPRDGGRVRNNGTFASNIAFSGPTNQQNFDYKARDTRTK